MSISRRFIHRSLVTAAATAVLGAGAVPAAQAGTKVVSGTSTTTTTITKDTKTTSTARKF